MYCASFPEPASVRIRPSLVLKVAVYQDNPDDVMEADPSVNHSEDQGAPIAQVLKLGDRLTLLEILATSLLVLQRFPQFMQMVQTSSISPAWKNTIST